MCATADGIGGAFERVATSREGEGKGLVHQGKGRGNGNGKGPQTLTVTPTLPLMNQPSTLALMTNKKAPD